MAHQATSTCVTFMRPDSKQYVLPTTCAIQLMLGRPFGRRSLLPQLAGRGYLAAFPGHRTKAWP